MVKTIYVCDLCGKEHKDRLEWQLTRSTFITETYSDNRKESLSICNKCARWIREQKGHIAKPGEQAEAYVEGKILNVTLAELNEEIYRKGYKDGAKHENSLWFDRLTLMLEEMEVVEE